MSALVLLDAGPLGMATNPDARPEHERCAFWLRALPSYGYTPVLPEIADYEVRRELLRAEKSSGLRRLNVLKSQARYLPITTEVMLLAAELWAQMRRSGRPTADDRALDADVILAAQARTLAHGGQTVIVATTNLRHLSPLVDARLWSDIS